MNPMLIYGPVILALILGSLYSLSKNKFVLFLSLAPLLSTVPILLGYYDFYDWILSDFSTIVIWEILSYSIVWLSVFAILRPRIKDKSFFSIVRISGLLFPVTIIIIVSLLVWKGVAIEKMIEKRDYYYHGISKWTKSRINLINEEFKIRNLKGIPINDNDTIIRFYWHTSFSGTMVMEIRNQKTQHEKLQASSKLLAIIWSRRMMFRDDSDIIRNNHVFVDTLDTNRTSLLYKHVLECNVLNMKSISKEPFSYSGREYLDGAFIYTEIYFGRKFNCFEAYDLKYVDSRYNWLLTTIEKYRAEIIDMPTNKGHPK